MTFFDTLYDVIHVYYTCFFFFFFFSLSSPYFSLSFLFLVK